ncbi:MAG: sterol desaturase family protein [Proteobacteria bacterium]|nr:sterol desaturase family protein [Pseudomonadota bacterium]
MGWLVSFALGLASWSLLEYVIHGVLSHRFRTFVSPLHWGHHQRPHGVFTSPLAWVPGALLVFGLASLAAGTALAGGFTLGVFLGFARYEWVHWRIHFREPKNERERLLRSHHLAHHFCRPRLYHGVTTRFWDRVFGTLPADCEADYARVASRPPLEGESNFRLCYSWEGVRVYATRKRDLG